MIFNIKPKAWLNDYVPSMVVLFEPDKAGKWFPVFKEDALELAYNKGYEDATKSIAGIVNRRNND